MEIRPLNLRDEAETRGWYAATYASASVDRIAPMIISESVQLASLRTNDTNLVNDRRAYGAWDGGTCVGAAVVGMPRVENTHRATIRVDVPPSRRHRGIGKALYDHAYAIARDAGRTTIHGGIEFGPSQTLPGCPGGRFALVRGFVSRNVEHRLMLDVPVPPERLASLEAYARENATGYQLRSWQGVPPEEWIGPFADMHTLTGRDVPTGELDAAPAVEDPDRLRASQQRMVDQGYGILTTLVLDPLGAPAAYTTMLATGDDVSQDDTFVLRAYRGHRLGALAKAANLRQLAVHYPGARRVHTWTADVNDAMRAINDRFGFRDGRSTRSNSGCDRRPQSLRASSANRMSCVNSTRQRSSTSSGVPPMS